MVLIVDVIKEVPENFTTFFDDFIKALTRKTFSEEGTEIQIIETGPREDWKTWFQLLPATSMEVKFVVNFEKKSLGIEVSFDLTADFISNIKKGGRLAKKMLDAKMNVFKDGLNNQLSMLIKQSLSESLKMSNKAVSEKITNNPLEILKLQLVKGEISEEEYMRKKKLLKD